MREHKAPSANHSTMYKLTREWHTGTSKAGRVDELSSSISFNEALKEINMIYEVNNPEVEDRIEEWGEWIAPNEWSCDFRDYTYKLTRNNDHHRQIGNMIRMIRESKKLSQVELGKAMGTSQPYISAIESGSQAVTIDQLIRIGEVLNCIIDIKITPR